ncbi:hypothetical protein ULG90_24520 [Halopseudomonas pachastrellae]|nr:hypothetical protein ULG90_24520 [Halopseudomonas pachastrellae]
MERAGLQRLQQLRVLGEKLVDIAVHRQHIRLLNHQDRASRQRLATHQHRLNRARRSIRTSGQQLVSLQAELQLAGRQRERQLNYPKAIQQNHRQPGE